VPSLSKNTAAFLLLFIINLGLFQKSFTTGFASCQADPYVPALLSFSRTEQLTLTEAGLLQRPLQSIQSSHYRKSQGTTTPSNFTLGNSEYGKRSRYRFGLSTSISFKFFSAISTPLMHYAHAVFDNSIHIFSNQLL